MMRAARAWLSMLLLLAATLAHAQFVPVPPLTGHVNDTANMLSAQQRAQLESVLTDYEQQTGSQIVILTVDKTEPEAIEQYSIRVTDQWKLGRKGVDDGVLLLVAPHNPPALRRLRIESGRGVQGVLTDAQSKRILQDVIAPHFRQNQFYDGMVAGVSAIATLLNKENLPPAMRQAQQQQRQQADDGSWWPFLFFGFIVLMTILRSGRGGYRRLSRGGWGAGATGFILGNVLSEAMRHGARGSGWGGGGFGGGGLGGGGFSGGGGSFDGGGASGDW